MDGTSPRRAPCRRRTYRHRQPADGGRSPRTAYRRCAATARVPAPAEGRPVGDGSTWPASSPARRRPGGRGPRRADRGRLAAAIGARDVGRTRARPGGSSARRPRRRRFHLVGHMTDGAGAPRAISSRARARRSANGAVRWVIGLPPPTHQRLMVVTGSTRHPHSVRHRSLVYWVAWGQMRPTTESDA